MTTPLRRVRSAADLLTTVLIATATLRLVSAVVGGIATWQQHGDFGPSGRFHVGEILAAFGSFGDGSGVLLLVAALLAMGWRRAAFPVPDGPPITWQTDALTWLLALTAAGAALGAIGITLEASVVGIDTGARLVAAIGFQASYLILALGGMVVVRRLDSVSGPAVSTHPDDEPGAAVFAVDRKTSAVLAWTSLAEARAKAPLYGVEDDEYEWFLDDGTVLRATVTGREVTLTQTTEQRPAALLEVLKEYALRRGIAIDDDEVNEPLAYVDPIARDHHLEMWPGWLRWLGRLAR